MDREQHSDALEARITAQRFEYKYAISEMQAMAIRDYISTYTVKDIHLGEERDYPLVSLYFDGPQMNTFWSSVHGERNRYKIRARAYVADRVDFVFGEIKYRGDQVLKKLRVRLAPEEANNFFGRNLSARSLFAHRSDREKSDFYAICDLMDRQSATPRVLVRYRREARISAYGEPVRITFDRNLECRPCFTYQEDIWTAHESWYRVPRFDIALEIKFTDTFPEWVNRLVKRFHLTACSICKYVLCVRALSQSGIRVGGTGVPVETVK